MLGISYDAPADNLAFRDKFGFPYDLLSDARGTASLAYGAAAADAARASRVSVLIGPDGRIAATFAEVVPAEHPDQVLADLDRLG